MFLQDITDINTFGICLLITCEEKYYLFTADCDARDIVKSLEANYSTVKRVYYVDAPHHGSKNNHSNVLFDYLEELHLVVSTNGKSHGHPDSEFLTDVVDYRKKIKNIHFNYNSKTKFKSDEENYNDGDYITIEDNFEETIEEEIVGLKKGALQNFAELVKLIGQGRVSNLAAKGVFAKMFATGEDPSNILDSLGLQQVSDESVILAAVQKVIAENPKGVADAKTKGEKSFGFLVGQTMKELKGKGNPQKINEILKKELLS